jgi:hypothetical protein
MTAEVDAPLAVRTVVVGDLDGDGCDDALALDGTPLSPAPLDGRLRVLLSACDGSGLLVQHQVATLAHATHAAAGDFDGDGTVDVVVALGAPSSSLAVMRGLGGGALAEPSLLSLDADPRSLAVVHLNADDRPDVAVATRAPDGVALLLNQAP